MLYKPVSKNVVLVALDHAFPPVNMPVDLVYESSHDSFTGVNNFKYVIGIRNENNQLIQITEEGRHIPLIAPFPKYWAAR